MPFSTYLASSLLNHSFRGDIGATAFTQPTTLYLALHDDDPTGAGLLATEISGGSYVRQSITFNAPNGSYEITNSNEISFIGLPSVPAGITHISVWDASSNGNMLVYDDYGSSIITEGDAITIAIGALTLRLLYLE